MYLLTSQSTAWMQLLKLPFYLKILFTNFGPCFPVPFNSASGMEILIDKS